MAARPDDRRHQWQVALAGGVGAGTALVLYDAIFGERGFIHWTWGARFGFLAGVGFITFLSIRFLDPYLERRYGRGGAPVPDPVVTIMGRRVRIPGSAVLVTALVEITENLVGGDQVFGRILLWVVGLVISTMITFYWVRGAAAQPRQATKLGAAAGGAVGAVFMVLMGMFGLLDAMFKVPVTSQWTAILVAMNAVGFAFAGAAGGLAIDRHWGGSPRPTVRVARLLFVPAVVWSLLIAAILQGPPWLGLAQELMRAAGWGLGLILFLPADAALGGQEPVRVEAAPQSAASI